MCGGGGGGGGVERPGPHLSFTAHKGVARAGCSQPGQDALRFQYVRRETQIDKQCGLLVHEGRRGWHMKVPDSVKS